MSTNNLTGRSAFIAAAFAASVLGVAQPVHALDFTFSFRGVEGYLTGLVDNTTNQIPATVFVTKSPTGQGEQEYFYWYTFNTTTGFSVANGNIVANNTGMLFRSVPPSAWPDYTGIYGGQPGANDGYGFDLALGDPGIGPIPSNGNGFFFSNVTGLDDGSSDVISYKAAAVPGPVPILGALAALRCSRTLRKRCRFQSSKSVAS